MKFKYEKVLDRHLNVFGYEVLHHNASKIPWSDVDDSWLNQNLIEQLEEIVQLCSVEGARKKLTCFLNLERKQLRDLDFVNKVSQLVHQIGQFDIKVCFEITERHYSEVNNLLQVDELRKLKEKYQLTFSADDVSYNDPRAKEIESDIYDFVKLEPQLFYTSCTNNFENVHNWMNTIKEKCSCKFIAEKVETKSMHDSASTMPFDYFQGYLYL
ncbi:EAL domain-containing protein [Vibrio hepatarius]|uniref:EAL domain-containing protein n=1 Tax=Vibrio hepatarius TaxID=171383 RepID=UPI00142D32D8|nr:EAL domain-containing protein [Vibrio hepatarius]NIY82239.1 EAL domain-containing protein [Vibrio hepatarius]NVJ58149.1 EAL domain-containing protein [Vibrionaceae bacterium]